MSYPPTGISEQRPKQLVESFSWLTPELRTVADGINNSVVIRGPALFSVEKYLDKGISLNQRKYVEEEIKRSARTLKGSYVDVNHETSEWEKLKKGPKPHKKGTVRFGEEEDGVLEYVAEVNDQEYAQKIRDTVAVREGKMTETAYFEKWHKKPLAGISVDAEFLKMQCPRCHKDFYDSETFKKHLEEDEFLKNSEWEPRGIVYKGLSLVEPPHLPGVKNADFEIVETQKGFSKLVETLAEYAKNREIRENGSGYILKTETKEPKKPKTLDEHLQLIAEAPEPYQTSYRVILDAMTKNFDMLKAECAAKTAVAKDAESLKETLNKQVTEAEQRAVAAENALNRVHGQFKQTLGTVKRPEASFTRDPYR